MQTPNSAERRHHRMRAGRHEILSRIEWCRLQRKGAVTRDEEEGWQAEEAGLVDALLGRDRTAMRKTSHPSLLERYELGLRDGQILMRVAPAILQDDVKSENMEGLGQVPSREQADPAETPVSPSTSSSLPSRIHNNEDAVV